MASLIRIGLLGAGGRMGTLVRQLLETDYAGRAVLAAGASKGDLTAPLLDSDVIIDFSLPEASQQMARTAVNAASSGRKIPAFVIGSTGWSEAGMRDLKALAEETPVFLASNFSTGVNALLEILKVAAPMLQRLGYTPVQIEKHHVHKKDAPSGTAKSINEVIAPEDPGSVQTHAVRAGEVIGDHEVTFHGKADKIVIGHFAQDRTVFARGALEAALWIASRKGEPKGLLSMSDFFREGIYTQR